MPARPHAPRAFWGRFSIYLSINTCHRPRIEWRTGLLTLLARETSGLGESGDRTINKWTLTVLEGVL